MTRDGSATPDCVLVYVEALGEAHERRYGAGVFSRHRPQDCPAMTPVPPALSSDAATGGDT